MVICSLETQKREGKKTEIIIKNNSKPLIDIVQIAIMFDVIMFISYTIEPPSLK